MAEGKKWGCRWLANGQWCCWVATKVMMLSGSRSGVDGTVLVTTVVVVCKGEGDESLSCFVLSANNYGSPWMYLA